MTHLWAPIFLIVAAACHVPFMWWWQSRMLRGVERETRDAVLHDLRTKWMMLYVAYAVAVGGVLAWLVVDWTAITSGQGGEPVTWAALLAFHGVWWPFVMPLIQGLDRSLRKHGVLAPVPQPGPTRTATLKPRCVSDYLPNWSTAVEVAILVVAATLLAARYAMAPAMEPRLALGAGVFALTGLAVLLSYGYWIRTEVHQSYSWLQVTEAEIEGLRRFRVRMIFAGQLAMALTLFIGSALFIEIAHGTLAEPTAGIVGGILGAFVGLGGGAAGTMASLRVARLQRTKQHRELH